MDATFVIHPLAPERLPDYLQFFDRDAFADNPDWSTCYCHFFNAPIDQLPWDEWTGERNRAAVSALISTQQMHGFLAYEGEKVVGWVHAAPRMAIRNLQTNPILAVPDAAQIGSIVCFVIARSYRGLGLARQLLEAACQSFRATGLTIAEAYPRKHVESDADAFRGPLALYQSAGFVPFRETERLLILRKSL